MAAVEPSQDGSGDVFLSRTSTSMALPRISPDVDCSSTWNHSCDHDLHSAMAPLQDPHRPRTRPTRRPPPSTTYPRGAA
jgi:hypothetical protein